AAVNEKTPPHGRNRTAGDFTTPPASVRGRRAAVKKKQEKASPADPCGAATARRSVPPPDVRGVLASAAWRRAGVKELPVAGAAARPKLSEGGGRGPEQVGRAAMRALLRISEWAFRLLALAALTPTAACQWAVGWGVGSPAVFGQLLADLWHSRR